MLLDRTRVSSRWTGSVPQAETFQTLLPLVGTGHTSPRVAGQRLVVIVQNRRICKRHKLWATRFPNHVCAQFWGKIDKKLVRLFLFWVLSSSHNLKLFSNQ